MQAQIEQICDFLGRVAPLDRQLAQERQLESLRERLDSLECLMHQQDERLRQLCSTSSSLTSQLELVRAEQAELRHCGGALRDCVLAGGALQPGALWARRRARAAQGALAAALGAEGPLRAVLHMAGDGGASVRALAAASRSTRELRVPGRGEVAAPAWDARGEAPPVCGQAAPRLELDEAALLRVKDHEPPAESLRRWADSATVQSALAGFWVEDRLGKGGELRFRDVHSVLLQTGLGPEQLVNKFLRLPTATPETDPAALRAAADAVLRRFASAQDRMSLCELYRLLEVVGCPLKRFKSAMGVADGDEAAKDGRPRIGGYHVRRQIGHGIKGVVCYEGERITDGARVAIKWPARKAEVTTLQEIHRKAPKDSPGLPRLLSSGVHEQEPYLVSELLGSSLTRVFQRLEGHPLDRKWAALRVVGRLALRRLQRLHELGFLHRDVSPENILLGRARGSDEATLYLIDYEHAQKYPGGGRAAESDVGSVEWSSIRSADGGEPRPIDDVEALGWVLLHGMFGRLPWFDWLARAYKDWDADSKWSRVQAIRQAQLAKVELLQSGWRALGWRRSWRVPADLDAFLRTCQRLGEAASAIDALPCYSELGRLLGAEAGLSPDRAEREDVRQFAEVVVPLLQAA